MNMTNRSTNWCLWNHLTMLLHKPILRSLNWLYRTAPLTIWKWWTDLSTICIGSMRKPIKTHKNMIDGKTIDSISTDWWVTPTKTKMSSSIVVLVLISILSRNRINSQEGSWYLFKTRYWTSAIQWYLISKRYKQICLISFHWFWKLRLVHKYRYKIQFSTI